MFTDGNRKRLIVIPVIVLVVVAGSIYYIFTSRLDETGTAVKAQGDAGLTSIPVSSVRVSPTQSPTPTPDNNSQSSNFQAEGTWQYPGSRFVSSSSSQTVYTSSDTPDVVTNWYKSKIGRMGYPQTAFSDQQSNGNILNLLSGQNGNSKISVQIQKDLNSTATKITIK